MEASRPWSRAIVLLSLMLLTLASAYDHNRWPRYGVSNLDSARWELVSMVDDLASKALDARWTDSNAASPDIEIAKAFDMYAERLKTITPPYDKWYRSTPVETFWVWTRLSRELSALEATYGTFSRFVRHQANERIPSPHKDWLEIARNQLSEKDNSAKKALDGIEKIILHADLFRQTLLESEKHLCSLQMSPNQIIYNTYNTITLAGIRGYAMTQFARLILQTNKEGNYTEEFESERTYFQRRVSIEVASAKSSMLEAERMIWRCDPDHHIEGKTFVTFTRLLQGYIENEVDMNPENTCRENCAYYQIAKNHGCFKDQFCSRQPACTGKILSCRFVDSDMWICPASRTSPRRYEWIEYENGRVLGKKGTCLRGQTKVDSWWRWLFWHCSYCMCICDQPGSNSDRFISLKEVVANINKNKVVTGIRFVKIKRVVYLQISEGTLLPGGKIDSESVTWREVKPKDLIYSVKGKDYHELTNEERAIDLDSLEGPLGYVLTGVRFKKLGGHLNFEIQVMPFNFTTGYINTNKYQWISNDNTDASDHKPRTRIGLTKPDVPTAVSSPSKVKSTSDEYTLFTHSDFDKDAAQSTVPYLDAQPVTPAFHVPLQGAGLYLKKADGSGGFIAPKILTYDYSNHITDYFPLEAVDDYIN